MYIRKGINMLKFGYITLSVVFSIVTIFFLTVVQGIGGDTPFYFYFIFILPVAAITAAVWPSTLKQDNFKLFYNVLKYIGMPVFIYGIYFILRGGLTIIRQYGFLFFEVTIVIGLIGALVNFVLNFISQKYVHKNTY